MKKNNGRTGLIIFGVIATLMICSAIGNATNPPSNAQTAHVATKAPTAKPTATPKPKPLTDEQKLQAIVSAVSYGQAKLSYDAQSQTVAIAWDLIRQWTTAANIKTIHDETFIVEKAVWTQWKGHLNAVGIIYTMHDAETNTDPAVGVAMLFVNTERTFDWANLDAETAWGMYDHAQD